MVEISTPNNPTNIDLVLLVDDDHIVNFLNTTIIKHTHRVGEIQSVTSGKNALDKLKEFQLTNRWPSIIFIDINMPGISGWELVELFKEKFPTLKNKSLICLLSSSLDPRDKAKAELSEWIDYFVSKPLTTEAVMHLYQQVRM